MAVNLPPADAREWTCSECGCDSMYCDCESRAAAQHALGLQELEYREQKIRELQTAIEELRYLMPTKNILRVAVEAL